MELVKTLTITVITKAIQQIVTTQEGKAQIKTAQQLKKITEATTKASVDRIMSNTESDNQIDLITAQNKKYTYKDEVITYLFLMPVVIATIVPFIIAYQSNSWSELNNLTLSSYESLDILPTWYKYVLGAVVIDVLGFRSFARKIVDKYMNKNEK